MSSSFQDWDSQERATLHLCPLLSALHWGLVKETDFSLTLGADEGRRPQSYTGGWRREQAPVLYCGTVKQAGHHKVLIMWSWEIHFYSLMMTQFQAFCSSITKSYPFQPLHWATSHHLNENRGQYHCQTQALLPALLMGYKALRNLHKGRYSREKNVCPWMLQSSTLPRPWASSCCSWYTLHLDNLFLTTGFAHQAKVCSVNYLT